MLLSKINNAHWPYDLPFPLLYVNIFEKPNRTRHKNVQAAVLSVIICSPKLLVTGQINKLWLTVYTIKLQLHQ